MVRTIDHKGNATSREAGQCSPAVWPGERGKSVWVNSNTSHCLWPRRFLDTSSKADEAGLAKVHSKTVDEAWDRDLSMELRGQGEKGCLPREEGLVNRLIPEELSKRKRNQQQHGNREADAGELVRSSVQLGSVPGEEEWVVGLPGSMVRG